MRVNLYIFVIFCIFQVAFAAFPSSIKSCPKKDTEEFDSCLIEVLNNIKPQLASGDFGNGVKLRSLEPLYTQMMEIDTPELKINMSDSTLLGTSNFRITSVKSDFEKMQFDIGAFTPVLNFKAKYSLHQHFKALKVFVKAVGDIEGVFKKARSKLRVKFSVKDDLSIELTDIQYKLKIADGQFNIESLIVKSDDSSSGGTNRILLKEIANNFINADPSFILRRVEPKLERHFMEYLTETIKALIKNVTLKDFFRS